jgi:hypothetical protein
MLGPDRGQIGGAPFIILSELCAGSGLFHGAPWPVAYMI